MKTKMNVIKKEAKQIFYSGGNNTIKPLYGLYNKGYCLYISNVGFNFSSLDYVICMGYDYSCENYKDYEWRLTDINYLKQGDICKVIYTHLPKLHIYVFDKITEHYIDVGDEDYENKFCALMWGIEDNRPVKDYPFENVYKLCKKSDKK